MTETLLLISNEAGVRQLRLNRPEKRNALSQALRAQLVAALGDAAADDGVAAVVIAGVGQHFCAGFDLAELADAPDPATVFADAGHYHYAVHTFAKPLLAAVNGSAMAGGLDLALMCDLRIVSRDATFGQPQVRHGIPAAYDLMAGVVGDAHARRLSLTGRIIDADEAFRIGLVGEVVDGAELDQAAQVQAAAIASYPNIASMKRRFLDAQPTLFRPAD